MITTDIFSKIGHRHQQRDDYIIKGSDPVPYIILSDGCSSSSNTEMGARILCYLAKQYLKYNSDRLYDIDFEKMGAWIIYNSELTVRQLGLNLSCLDATLIIAFELDGYIKICMFGDGAILKYFNNDKFKLISVNYSRNCPYYLSYLLKEGYPEDTIKTFTVHYTENVVSESETILYNKPTIFNVRMDEHIKAISICSDGILSFTKGRDLMDPSEYVPKFMDFKGTKGVFLLRRMKAALKELNDDGIIHHDDLSIGTFLNGNIQSE